MARRQQFEMASQPIRPSEDPTYRQSRAAQRQMYGTRRIDARANQSAQDYTPSGRAARRKEEGFSENQSDNLDQIWWKDQFKPRAGTFAHEDSLPGLSPDPTIAQPQALSRKPPGTSVADEILDAYARGMTSGTFRTPYDTPGGGVAYGDAARTVPFGGPPKSTVVPQSNLPPSAMTDFLPKQPRGYMSSVLDSAPRWQKPLTRYG